jgi:RNA polymerase sigma-70 factor (ECF subfamily)
MLSGHNTQPTSPSLLVRIRDPRDVDSWQTFVDVYAPVIYRYCRRRGLQDADAADVGQEVLAQVLRSIRSFEYQPERGRFRDWLGAVARGKVVRFLENQARGVRGTGASDKPDRLNELPSGDSDPDWTAEFHARLLEAALERIRPQLSERSWLAFDATWRQDRPAIEVARTLDMPIDAVYVAKSRALQKLREEVLLLAEDVPQFIPSG